METIMSPETSPPPPGREPRDEPHVALARAMTALSHPRRALIFERLSRAGREGLTFEALRTATGLPVAALSHHLRPMADAAVVERRRKGAYVLHRLKPGALNAACAQVERGLALAGHSHAGHATAEICEAPALGRFSGVRSDQDGD